MLRKTLFKKFGNTLLILILLFLSSRVNAQVKHKVEIRGNVYNSKKESIAFAVIKFNLENLTTVHANQVGHFSVSFNADTIKTLKITVHAPNYLDNVTTVILSKSNLVILDTIMLEDKVIALKQINVHSSTIYRTIDKTILLVDKELSRSSVTSFDILKKLPYVSINNDDLVTLKGKSDIKYFLNGKSVDLNVVKGIPPAMITKIESSTTPGAEYDAEGTGGVINVITRVLKGNTYEGSIGGSIGTKQKYNSDIFVALKQGKFNTTINYTINAINKRGTQESIGNNQNMISIQDAQKRNNQTYQYAGVSESYDIDTSNVIGGSFGYYKYNFKRNNNIEFEGGIVSLLKNLSTINNTKKAGLISDFDYKHIFKNKDEFLISYENNFLVANDTVLSIHNLNLNKTKFIENTVQATLSKIKYKNGAIQLGLKYINRRNISTARYNDSLSSLTYKQSIYAAYGLIKLPITKTISFKIGLRAELTNLNAVFNQINDINRTNFNLFPNFTIAYALKGDKNITLSYNQSIKRPGIDYLNPFYNYTDPQNIFVGNPNLLYEIGHDINLDYSLTLKSFYIQTGVYYSKTSNSITPFVTPLGANQFLYTFTNSGREHNWGADASINGNIIKIWEIGFSAYAEQAYISNGTIVNQGYNYQINQNNVFKLPKGIMLTNSFSFTSKQINLQGYLGHSYSDNIRVSKKFLNKKLTTSIGVDDPLNKVGKYTDTYVDSKISVRNNYSYENTRLVFSINYYFGKRDSTNPYSSKVSNTDMKTKP